MKIFPLLNKTEYYKRFSGTRSIYLNIKNCHCVALLFEHSALYSIWFVISNMKNVDLIFLTSCFLIPKDNDQCRVISHKMEKDVKLKKQRKELMDHVVVKILYKTPYLHSSVMSQFRPLYRMD